MAQGLIMVLENTLNGSLLWEGIRAGGPWEAPSPWVPHDPWALNRVQEQTLHADVVGQCEELYPTVLSELQAIELQAD